MKHRIGFLGGGKMAQSMAEGFILAGLTDGAHLYASFHPQDTQDMEIFKKIGAETFTESISVVQKSNIVFISCPPLAVASVLHEIKHHGAGRLFISIAKDVTIENIERMISEHYMAEARVIRVVSNPPTLVGCGVSVFIRGKNVTLEDLELTKKLLNAIGTCDEISESLLEPCIAMTGTGQAAAFVMIESMADAGVRMGMPREMALKIACQTCLGTGALARQTGKHPAILKDDVTSSGGSTAAGLVVLEQNAFRYSIGGAIEAAHKHLQNTPEVQLHYKKSKRLSLF